MATKILYAVPMAHEATLPVLERLRAEGCELTFNRTGRTLTEDELIALLPGVFGTIAGGEAYTEWPSWKSKKRTGSPISDESS